MKKLLLVLSLVLLTGMARAQVKIWEGLDVSNGRLVKLTSFLAEDNPTGTAVIVCPGGSYYWLDKKNEGDSVAMWLQNNGISAFVLEYRAAGIPAFAFRHRAIFRGRRYPDMITDAQRALQWVRTHADEYHINPDKVGMVGFSAGGHLVTSVACFHNHDYLKDIGIDNHTNLRPDFVGAIYPVVTMVKPYVHKRSRRGLLGEQYHRNPWMCDSLSLEQHIPADCPPIFIANCIDDPVVDYRNSVILDSALTAANIPHCYVQFKTGGHSFGASEKRGTQESRQWKTEFLKWLTEIKFYDNTKK
jgi:acetyl esterase/lipase